MAAVMDALNSTSSIVPASTIEATVGALNTSFLGAIAENTSTFGIIVTLLAAAVVYDQLSYWRQKGTLAGPAWKIPFIGPFLESVWPKFEAYHAKWLSAPLSCVSVFHKFVIIASTRDMARQIFNAPAYVKPCVVDVAIKLLRAENWVFLDGKAHVAYMPGQQEVYEEYFEAFHEVSETARKEQSGVGPDKGGAKFVYHLRELTCAVACRTFVGHYMSHAQVKEIADDYYNITAALELVNFPIILPFTKTWYGKKAADKVLETFASCAAKSKIRMRQPGAKAECIMDRWVSEMMYSERYRERIANGETVPAEEKPQQLLREFSDIEISMTVFTFLFASQDATSSAASWLLQLVADRPEVLKKVRDEGKAVMGDKFGKYGAITIDDVDKLEYTRAVVKETLRYRPPVIMVPYLVKKDYPVTPTYTAPKGSMLIPSTWLSLHDPEAYPTHGGADEFAPERWTEADAEDKGKNWLVFGTGPHYCLGQQYAVMNLMVRSSLPTVYTAKQRLTSFPAYAPPPRRKLRLAPPHHSHIRGDQGLRHHLPYGKFNLLTTNSLRKTLTNDPNRTTSSSASPGASPPRPRRQH
jgi:C-22 sterol desaturase